MPAARLRVRLRRGHVPVVVRGAVVTCDWCGVSVVTTPGRPDAAAGAVDSDAGRVYCGPPCVWAADEASAGLVRSLRLEARLARASRLILPAGV